MNVSQYVGEIEKYLDSFREQIQDEKRDLVHSQKKFSSLLRASSQKASTSSVLESLFKDEETDIFHSFNNYEEKRRQLALERRAEYNAYLEKKEKELEDKRQMKRGKEVVSAKSILDSVNYEQILAKRREEEAQFRNINLSDTVQSPQPIFREHEKKSDLGSVQSLQNGHSFTKKSSDQPSLASLPAAKTVEEIPYKLLLEEQRKRMAALEAENAHLIEERIARQLEEQRRQMLFEFESELKKNNQIREEINKHHSAANSVPASPIKIAPKIEEVPKFGRTGGGGEPVRDSFGNIITLRGSRKENFDNYSSFPSMQQHPIKDRMALYREELQKQIEEKKRLEALEKAKEKEMEEKIAQRIEEQRLKIQREYERELETNNKIKEEFQRQQERINKLEEFQRRDAEERRKKRQPVKPPEVENISPNIIVPERNPSPPIPAVRTKVLLEKALPPSSPVPEIKPENVFSSLAEIRRKIKEEQKKAQKETSYEIMNRRTVQDLDEDDEDFFQTSLRSST